MSLLYQTESIADKPKGVAESPTKAYNLLWISPHFPTSGEEFRQPIPDQTIENIYGIAERNPNTDVQLWIDSRRMTDAQIGWLEKIIGKSSSINMVLHDFRNVPEYNNHSLYNQPDDSPNWRFDKHSLIWRQVDAARILACLQSGQDQVFYSDADVTNLIVDSDEVQSRIKKHGIILAGAVDEKSGYPWYENQLFGFDSRKRDFFRLLYNRTLNDIAVKGEKGYGSYIDLINSELKGREGIDTRDIVFQARYDGTVAIHPKRDERRK
ncbi:MAG: hypothetical protein ABIG37_02270 [Nanoarchaeota archaeon]|nr:hypothetical protein [Nanoarchaeota archaeon]